jgi:iron(III) transport system permease protein
LIAVAALLALVLVCITLILLAVEARAQGKARLYSRSGSTRYPRIARLGRWKWPALMLCALVSVASLGIPIGVIIYWLVRGLQSGETIVLWLGPAWRSVVASSAAAALALLGALPVALMVERYPTAFSKLVERVSYIGYALPGIVVALALVFFGANFATPLYQTFAMLVFAYAVRYLPQATGALRATIRQISPRVEEAARSLGSSTPRVLFRITIPLVRRGLLSGGALVFLTSMKELPATLLLAPTGYNTLATRVWGATEEAFYARAAAPALMLVLVSALSIAFILGPDEGHH